MYVVLKCSICGEEFENADELFKHYREEHGFTYMVVKPKTEGG